uniref:Glycosyltransferase n=1 Tax=Physcomitrium patens TaxID=3218 RepID=A0A2K1IAW7_PHYPA|nr:hypothetical protein PHYPA_030996 [Physcomitrium patens]
MGVVHVVLVVPGATGHAIPFMYLATKLASFGVKVTMLVYEKFESMFQTSIMYKQHRKAIQEMDIQMVGVDDGIYDGTPGTFPESVKESSELKLVDAFTGAMSRLMSSTSPPCCILSDMLVGWTQILAAKFNIPRHILHIQSTLDLSVMLHVPTLLAEGRLPFTEKSRNELVKIPGMEVPLHPSELPSDLHPEFLNIIDFSYEFFLRMSRRAIEAPIVLVNTRSGSLKREFWPPLTTFTPMPKVIPVGPLHPSADLIQRDWDEISEEPTIQFLSKQPPSSVIYIAFGTGGTLSREQAEELALGLEASEQPFLWVGGPNRLNPLAENLDKILPQGFENRVKDRGMVVSTWVPQPSILRHPSTGAFLSHTGWTSTLEGMAAGLPILAWPQRFEQYLNSRYLVDVAKVAAEFRKGSDGLVTRDEVERVVRRVMKQDEGRALQSNAHAMKEAAHKRAASPHELQTFLSLMTQAGLPH